MLQEGKGQELLRRQALSQIDPVEDDVADEAVDDVAVADDVADSNHSQVRPGLSP